MVYRGKLKKKLKKNCCGSRILLDLSIIFYFFFEFVVVGIGK